VPPGELGVVGDTGDAVALEIEPPLMTVSRPDARPVGEMGVPKDSEGV